jgi:hypothetical protein
MISQWRNSMSFTEFTATQSAKSNASGAFRHSQQTLSTYKEPTEAETADVAAKAKAIATEVAQKFDAEYQGLTQKMLGAQTQLGQFYQMGMPPPLALFQSVVYQLVHLSNTCKAYQSDADALAAVGAADFQSYLKLFVDDAATALAQAQATPTAFMTGPSFDPATFFASTGAAPPTASPFKTSGPLPLSGRVTMSAEDAGIFGDANKAIQGVTSRISSAWGDYFKS